jgi:hypothetical protein
MQARNPPQLNFNQFVQRLGNALGLDRQQQQDLNNTLNRFSDADRFRLVQNIDTHIRNLEQADNRLRDLIENGPLAPYRQSIEQSWNMMNQELVELQILSLIQRNEDCSQVIQALLDVLNNKIRNVNQILKNNLEPQQVRQDGQIGEVRQGNRINLRDAANLVMDDQRRQRQGQGFRGGSNDYMLKYLKYKNKYISLKKMI